MPTVPASKIDAVRKDAQVRVRKLMAERAVCGYTFSYERLAKLIDPEQLQSCIVAYTEGQARDYKEDLNAALEKIFKADKIETLEHPDPFGRNMAYARKEGRSITMSFDRVVEACVNHKISATLAEKIAMEARKESTYNTIQCTEVREPTDKKSKSRK